MLLRWAIVSAVAIGTPCPVAAQPAPPPTAVSPPPALPAEPLFALVYRRGPAWIAGKPMHEQQLGGHFRYMQGLQREGRLVAAGPFADTDGGMALVRARDRAAALALLAADPAIVDRIFVAEVRNWSVALGPESLKSR